MSDGVKITPGGDPVCEKCGRWYGLGDRHTCPTPVDLVAEELMRAWERAEGKAVGASYVATFADMARAIMDARVEGPVHKPADWHHACSCGVAPGWSLVMEHDEGCPFGAQLEFLLKQAKGFGRMSMKARLVNLAVTWEDRIPHRSGAFHSEAIERDRTLDEAYAACAEELRELIQDE